MEEVNIIFPNQLFEKSPLFDYKFKTYLIEEFLFFKQYKFHKKKIFFHRVSMKKYYDYCLKYFDEEWPKEEAILKQGLDWSRQSKRERMIILNFIFKIFF